MRINLVKPLQKQFYNILITQAMTLQDTRKSKTCRSRYDRRGEACSRRSDKRKNILPSVEGFALAFVGAHGDTDFLRLCSRLQEDKTSSFHIQQLPRHLISSRSSFGVRLCTENLQKQNPSSNKLQDEGFSGTVTQIINPVMDGLEEQSARSPEGSRTRLRSILC